MSGGPSKGLSMSQRHARRQRWRRKLAASLRSGASLFGYCRDDVVDDLLEELFGERGVTVQQSVVDGPVQQVEGDVQVGVHGDLAAVTAPEEELAGRVAPGLDEVAAVQLGELAVRLSFSDETGDDAGVGLAVQLSKPGK